MAINLKKGQTIDLRKNVKGESVHGLSKVTLGLGWDVLQEKKGFFGKIFGGNQEEEFDLDAIAFLLDENGKIANEGKHVKLQNGHVLLFQEGDVIYYNNMTFPSGSGPSSHLFNGMNKYQMQNKVNDLLAQGETIVHTGDNLTGEGEGDDEQILIKLDLIPPRIHKILLLVSIYLGVKQNQHFGKVENAFIRACDDSGKEIARYNLSNTPELNGKCSLEFAELYRKDGTWKFRALGNSHHTDDFVEIAKKYVYNS